jgi:hypothetical protein
MKYKLSIVSASIALTCAGAHAQGLSDIGWKFSGFGTVGIVHSSEKNADFTARQAEPDGAGHTRSIDLFADSKLGAQLDATLNPQWSGSVQVLSEYLGDGTFDPEVSSAFVKWQPATGIALRAGRMPYSAFLVSDYHDIGYSQTWVRPPREIYMLSFRHFDGVDATWRTNVGDVALRVQALAGRSTDTLSAGKLTGKGLASLNVTADLGEDSIRLSYLHLDELSYANPGLLGAAQLVGAGVPAGALGAGSPALPADPSAAAAFNPMNKPIGYATFGYSHDSGTWFVTSEFGHITAWGPTGTSNEFYLTGGSRFGSFTPYATFADYRHGRKPASTSPVLAGAITAVNASQEKSFSLGTRWDFTKSADLKIQVDHAINASGSHGFLSNEQPDFVPGKSYNVYSAAVDFVF